MSELYLIRHGQASFGAQDYDQLSELGYQQSRWLGEHFARLGLQFDRVITGNLKRQQQTARGILEAMGQDLPLEQHPGLEEFNFLSLATVYSRLRREELPDRSQGPKPFFQLLRRAMKAWSLDELHDELGEDTEPGEDTDLETWQAFHERVAAALASIREHGGDRVLAVSSGGAIAMALSQLMQCNVDTLINLNLQARNTGVSHLYFNQKKFIVSSFNAAPHLEVPGRQHALTHA